MRSEVGSIVYSGSHGPSPVSSGTPTKDASPYICRRPSGSAPILSSLVGVDKTMYTCFLFGFKFSLVVVPRKYLNTLLTVVQCSFPGVYMYLLNTPIAWEILGRVQTI